MDRNAEPTRTSALSGLCGRAFEHRAEERLEAVAGGQGAQVPAAVDDRGGHRRMGVSGVDGDEVRRVARGTRRRPVRSPRARSNRSRRPGGRPARPPPRRAAASAAPLRRAAARSASRRRQRMSGSRRSVPSPEQGASTSTQENCRGERQRLRRVRLHEPHVRCARLQRRSGASSAMRAAATSHAITRPVPTWPRHRGGLAAGRRAGVEQQRARRRAGQQRHELRRLVLHDEHAAGDAARRAAAAPRRR